jgi:signal transduction histidine kinase
LPQEVAAEINGTDLIQVLLNLAINAFQSSQQSLQVDITGYLVNQSLDLDRLEELLDERFIAGECFQNRAPLALSVRDSGPGISPEVLSRIFEPCSQPKPQEKARDSDCPSFNV